jgi:uncharacterized protein YjbI with pentapeptide repeats
MQILRFSKAFAGLCATRFLLLLSFSCLLFLLLFMTQSAAAFLEPCRIERSPAQETTVFKRHVAKACSDQDREAEAITAEELLTALKAAKTVDLAGVDVKGDVMLDRLPLVSRKTAELEPWPGPALPDRLQEQTVRVIPGALSIRNSVVRGALAVNPKEGVLVLKGPVSMTGTRFERSVDFSRSIFLGPVDLSDAVILHEAFFIGAVFSQAARFEKTAFGVHSRFHRAIFKEPVTFLRAGFNGLAEFLEVTFEKDASFSRTYFKMGTGFSGSRFGGTLDFSEALFEREAFFAFTVFEGDAYFRRATFRADASFSDAEFKGIDDFSKAFFNSEPRFTGTRFSGTHRTPGGLQDPRFFYAVAAAMLVFALLFILALRKR